MCDVRNDAKDDSGGRNKFLNIYVVQNGGMVHVHTNFDTKNVSVKRKGGYEADINISTDMI